MRSSKIFVFSMLIMTMLCSFSFATEAEERVSLGFLYGWTDIGLIDRTNGSVNQVSPTCLDLNSKGELVVTSNLTHTFVNAMHERNIKVTPFLSNHWARGKGIKALENADTLVDSIMEVVYEYELDGINVDIENLDEEYRDLLSSFVIKLNQKMPEEKILSVSVAANPKSRETGWQGSYDYKVLGENSDYLMVMAYDQHSQGGPEGPIASREFVEDSIVYTLNFVSKDKIILGIPLFGRYWKYDHEYDSYDGGKAVVMGAIPALFEKFSGDNMYNEYVGESRYIFDVDNNEISGTINGEELQDGTYIIWYQGNEGIKDKLDIVNRYDLLGVGIWALGQEKVDVWEYFKEELNKTPRTPDSKKVEIVQEVKYEAIKEDLTPINNEIKDDRKTISKDCLEFINSLQYEEIDAYNFEPHEKAKDVSELEYKKIIEKLPKNKRKKIRSFTKIKKGEVHRLRMEKTF